MAELKGNKRRLSINLSFLTSNDQTQMNSNSNSSTKSPKKFGGANGVFFSAFSPPAVTHGNETAVKAVFETEGFLSSCYLCKKKLHGLDIFMYREGLSSSSSSRQISLHLKGMKKGSFPGRWGDNSKDNLMGWFEPQEKIYYYYYY